MTPLTSAFEAQRPRLLGIAYRITGSRADAEDIVQEAWTRLQRLDDDVVRDPVGWLVTVVSRLGLDELKRAQRRREVYVGPWLPEPVATPDARHDPEAAAELAESLTLAFLQLLDALTPPERVAFLLADVFDQPFSAISEILGRSEPACRQLASRARRRVGTDARLGSATGPEQLKTAQHFVAVLLAGDVEGLLRMLAPDVVLTSDGGPQVRAARRPIVGAQRVSRALSKLPSYSPGLRLEPTTINNGAGFVAQVDGIVVAVGGFDVAVGRITAIRVVVNPDKLRGFDDAVNIV